MAKVTMTRIQLRGLAGCIRLLDGRMAEMKDKDGKPTGEQILKPFDLSAKARYALAKTASLIQGELDATEKAVRGLHDKASGQALDVKEERDVLDFLQETTEVDVHELDVTELKIDTNQLAPTLISGQVTYTHG